MGKEDIHSYCGQVCHLEEHSQAGVTLRHPYGPLLRLYCPCAFGQASLICMIGYLSCGPCAN